MPRYANPFQCPDCAGRLPAGALRCPSCRLILHGPLPDELFRTLRTADDLVARIRVLSAPPPEPVPVPLAAAVPPVAGPPVAVAPVAVPRVAVPPVVPALVAATPPRPQRHGVSGLSVPRILLGLGALCLLVAGIIFLAVAWAWLGIGGRTAVLIALTATTGALGVVFRRRGLDVAAESLTTVALGLLALDVIGADRAGWLGDLSLWGLVCAVGGVVAVGALGLAAATRLVSAQLIAVGALAAAGLGALGVTDRHQLVIALAVLANAAVAAGGRARKLQVLAPLAAIAGAEWWLALLATGAEEALHHPTLSGLWVDGHGTALLAASLMLLLPVPFARAYRPLTEGLRAAAAVALTLTFVLPVVDESVTSIGVVSLAVLGCWTVVAALRAWRWVAWAPMITAALPVLAITCSLAGAAVANAFDTADPFTAGIGLRLGDPDPAAAPALLVAGLAALAAGLWVGLGRPTGAAWPLGGATTVALGAVATLALHPVPLWTVTAGLTLIAAALTTIAVRRSDAVGTATAAAAITILGLAIVLALPSDLLTTLALGALTATAVAVLQLGRFPHARIGGAVLLPPAAAALVWTAQTTAGVDLEWRALAVIATTGVLALVLSHTEIQLPAALSALAATLVSLIALVPVADADVTRVGVVALAVLGCWTIAATLLPAWLRVAWAAMAAAAVPVVAITCWLAGTAMANAFDTAAPFTAGIGLRLGDPDPAPAQALLVAGLAALAASLWVALSRPSGAAWPLAGVTTVALGAVATLALNPVPLWTVTAGLTLVAAALTTIAVRRSDAVGTAAAGTATAILGLAIVLALPSDLLTTFELGALTATALAVLHLGRFTHARTGGALLLPAAAAALVWTVQTTVGVDPEWRALAVIATAGLLALARPEPEIDLPAALSALAATVVSLVALVYEDLTTVGVVALAVLGCWTVAAVVLPAWLRVAWVAMASAAMPVLAITCSLAGTAVANAYDTADPFTAGIGLRLGDADPAAAPALLVAGLAALAAGLWVGLGRPTGAAWPLAAATTLALGVVATLALYPVPLWTVAAGLTLIAAALTTIAVRRTDHVGTGTGGTATALLGLAIVLALPSDLLTTLELAALTTAALAFLQLGNFPDARTAGALLLPPAAAALVWTAQTTAGIDLEWRALAVIATTGLLALALPEPEIEVPAALSALAATLVSLDAVDGDLTRVAIHLTLAGVLVSTSALIHPSRRNLGWVGSALLAAATWTRFYDVGVEAPEAYTLPSAIALIVVGVVRMRRDPEASTHLALTPGLLLATTPSLLWVLADPLSLRAALLGIGCLGLVLAGVALRWSAPLLVGSAVGAILVVRELAPYAVEMPQWVLIGLAGTVLTVVGVTWESRMRDLRQATAYVERLR